MRQQHESLRGEYVGALVLLPFIQQLREQHDGYVEGAEVPTDQTVVSWCDGDLAQMAVMIDEEQLETNERLRIIANKQSAARSGAEQAADPSPLFRLLKRSARITQ